MSNAPPTPISTLQLAQKIGYDAGLHYVYVGNVPGEANTHCHECGKLLMRRSATRILEDHINSEGYCPACHMPVAGVGMGGAKAVVS